MKWFSLLIILSFLISCRSFRTQQHSSQVESNILDTDIPPKDSIAVSIIASNLSEDMSKLSSGDDEVLFIVYEFQTPSLDAPLAYRFLHFTKAHTQHQFQIPKSTSQLLIILLELDTESNIEQIDPVFRIYHQEIANAWKSHNQVILMNYLGDNDLLGISTVKAPCNKFFQGIQKMDRYNYQIILE